MGNVTEFERVANLLMSTLSFEQDINVSVFETNIRGIIIFVKVPTLAVHVIGVSPTGTPCIKFTVPYGILVLVSKA